MPRENEFQQHKGFIRGLETVDGVMFMAPADWSGKGQDLVV